MSNKGVVIVNGARTPIGTLGGSLSTVKASDLGAVVIKEALNRSGVNAEDVDEVIFGQVLTAGQGQNPCRQAALKAGIPERIPAYTINMLCGSGLKSVFLGYQSIMCGLSNVMICGGQESMSQAPHVACIRPGIKLGNMTMSDTLLQDGLIDAMHNIHVGVTAENIGKKYNINRQDQDEFATMSQYKTEEAIKMGYFKQEIVPVVVPSPKASITVTDDEHPKPGTTVEKLARLKPVFEKEGNVTAGNASGINDGAAAVVLMDQELASSKGLVPLGKIVAIAQAGVDPLIMGTGPIPAIKEVLQKANWKKEEVDLFELNEAFAVQSLACIRELGLDEKKVNVSGGAIALGHPLGASGCRVLITLLYALQRLQKNKGVASLCVGGGMGVAIAVERIIS